MSAVSERLTKAISGVNKIHLDDREEDNALVVELMLAASNAYTELMVLYKRNEENAKALQDGLVALEKAYKESNALRTLLRETWGMEITPGQHIEEILEKIREEAQTLS